MELLWEAFAQVHMHRHRACHDNCHLFVNAYMSNILYGNKTTRGSKVICLNHCLLVNVKMYMTYLIQKTPQGPDI